MENELTQGPVMKTMLRFAVPMILGDLLQQCYNIADTLIVGKFLGADALFYWDWLWEVERFFRFVLVKKIRLG